MRLLIVLVAGCHASAPAEQVTVPPPGDAAKLAVVSADAAPVDAACTELDIGLDLRALPVHGARPSDASIDSFTQGQAQDLIAKAGLPRPTVMTFPGGGRLYARFETRAQCERATTAYLMTAPKLPVIMQPAAQVTTACRPCT